jgi:hypothetical protein
MVKLVWDVKCFEVLTVVKMRITVFWFMILCIVIGSYQSFGGMYQFHLQSRSYEGDMLL